MISPEQCRAARAWLAWTQADLAREAKVDRTAISFFEEGKRKPRARTLGLIEKAIEDAGLGLLSIPGGPTGIAVRCPKVAEA